MLGLGTGELVLIGVVALLVIGPERLPVVMRQLGRWYGQIRRTADELRRAFVLEADRQDAADRYKKLAEQRKKAQEEARRRLEAQKADGAQAQPAPPPAEGAPTELVPNDVPPDAPAHAAPPLHTMSELAPPAPAPEPLEPPAEMGR
jgi:sec-independent protein translocase protein TatB